VEGKKPWGKILNWRLSMLSLSSGKKTEIGGGTFRSDFLHLPHPEVFNGRRGGGVLARRVVQERKLANSSKAIQKKKKRGKGGKGETPNKNLTTIV